MSRKVAETSFDLELALQEVARARTEVAAAARSAPHRLDKAMSEPLARVELARRALSHVLERHGWKPYTASPNEVGAARPPGIQRRRSVASPEPRSRRRGGRRKIARTQRGGTAAGGEGYGRRVGA